MKLQIGLITTLCLSFPLYSMESKTLRVSQEDTEQVAHETSSDESFEQVLSPEEATPEKATKELFNVCFQHHKNGTIPALLAQPANLEAINKDGETPLVCAVLYKNKEACHLLIDHGADYSVSYKERPLIFWIIEQGLDTVIEKLIEKGVDLTVTDEGKTPLEFAESKYNTKITKMLKLANPEKATEELFRAIFRKHPTSEIPELITKYGADVNGLNKYGSTPLQEALLWSNEKAALLLLEHGALTDTPDKDNNLPIFEALGKRMIPVVKKLVEKGVNLAVTNKLNQTPLGYAKSHYLNEIAAILEKAGAPQEIVKSEEELAQEELNQELHSAIIDKDLAKCIISIQKGADVNKPSSFHLAGYHTPVELLFWAVPDTAEESLYFNIAHLLFSHGAKYPEVKQQRNTPLHVAAEHGWNLVSELLLEHTQDVDSLNKSQYTPLFLAATNGHTETAELLISQGAQVDAMNSWGETLLYSALFLANGKDKAGIKYLKAAKLLVNKGSNIHAKRDRLSSSPLEYAQDNYMDEFLAFLEKKSLIESSRSSSVQNNNSDDDLDSDEDYKPIKNNKDKTTLTSYIPPLLTTILAAAAAWVGYKLLISEEDKKADKAEAEEVSLIKNVN